ncbi:pyridoxal phosphate-dependent transferase [Infundibulicybe gibba]|nr:pyridoxal phosphate-dependent transferase [Infundibulicybe gibba]
MEEFAVERPDAIDLSHHLSTLSRARGLSPLKGLQRYFGKPGIISLAGGLPSPDYFPIHSLDVNGLVSDSFPVSPTGSSSFSWLWNLLSGYKKKEHTVALHIPKYPANPNDLSLSTALQYSTADGMVQLQDIIKEFTAKVYRPAYGNFHTLVHTGNTDGWVKAMMTLCNPGEALLVCEWTYPAALATALPFHLTPVPVKMDAQGMRSDSLRSLLASWDEPACGTARPHVMYTIPVGQNPTGGTMGEARKREIYELCVEYDIIIVEDDPYYFLQQGPYTPGIDDNTKSPTSANRSQDVFPHNLVPSYLRIDYQGRVIRLDTFSKTIAPGCRLGWFTCNPLFAERLERQGETSSQAPCGFGQSVVISLLSAWKYDGYIRWLKGLRTQYRGRRDFFIGLLADEFHLETALETSGIWEGATVYTAYNKAKGGNTQAALEKSSSSPPMFSFVPPTSGMFVWLWVALAEAGVLFAPGNNQGDMFSTVPSSGEAQNCGHFRISFSNGKFEDMKRAVVIFGTVLRKFYKDL